MSKIFNVIFFIININQIFSLILENNSNIVTLKFRTYYPYVENNLNKSEIYYKKIHSSKLYLELQTGNDTSYKKGKNQILNTIINLKEVVLIATDLYFDQNTEKNNNLLCTYNTSVSDTFSESEGYFDFKGIKSLSSYSKEYFKIYRDIFLEKYNIDKLNILCTINHNISKLCGNIGLAYFHTESKAYNFLGQLHSHFSLLDFTFLFNYTGEDEGIFIFGNKPHIYLPDKYNESDLFSFYTKYIYEFNLDSVSFYINDNLTDENIYIKISPDIEGFQFPTNYFNILEKIFFEKYYRQNICKNEKYKSYSIIYCDERLTDEMRESFPEIIFKITNITFKFTGKDLFYKYENNFYFIIIERPTLKHFDLGRLFFKKYIIPINPESRQIFFYQNKKKDEKKENIGNKNNDQVESKYIIIIIVLAILFMILFPLGIYLGKKINKKRNKKAYELTDGYDYTPSKEGSEPLYKE